MNKTLRNAMARGGLSVLFLMGVACRGADPGYTDLAAAEAADLLDNPEVFLLDVRTPPENLSVRIPGDRLVPLPVLEKELAKLPEDRDRPVLIYCRSGNRSVTAAKILARAGYARLYNLRGGILEWQKSGLPVEKGPRASEDEEAPEHGDTRGPDSP